MIRTPLLYAALALVSACGSGPEAPSTEQNRQMDEAAEMLNQAPDSLSNIDDSAVRNSE